MARQHKTIDDIGEFGFIRSISGQCINNPDGVILGIGDDCAVIGPFGQEVLLVTTDLLVENIHFILDRIPPEDLGQKAMAVNLSDIAAMGGTPRHAFVSLSVPHLFPVRVLDGIYAGIKAICREYDVNILGGDTSASPAGLFINIALLGQTFKDWVIYRKGASPGDKLYVCGTVGDSAAGLKILKGEVPADEGRWQRLIESHTRPRPQVELGKIIAESRLASAMIDLSDGLIADLGHICEQSGVGAIIREDWLPLSEELQSFAQTYNLDIMELALAGGEDYRLLVTVPQDNTHEFKALLRNKGHTPPTEIGTIVAGSGLRCVGKDGSERKLSKLGFEHF